MPLQAAIGEAAIKGSYVGGQCSVSYLQRIEESRSPTERGNRIRGIPRLPATFCYAEEFIFHHLEDGKRAGRKFEDRNCAIATGAVLRQSSGVVGLRTGIRTSAQVVKSVSSSLKYSPTSACRKATMAVGSKRRASAVDRAVTPKP